MTLSQTAPRHHVIIGTGIAGSSAAEELRDRDPDSRITIITLSRLPFYHRHLLPQVFRDVDDWRTFQAYPPAHYRDRRITLRRDTRVARVDAPNRLIHLAHKETVRYDMLVVATGGRSYLPEGLVEFFPLLHSFGSFKEALATRQALPDGGRVVMLGGDMIGLNLARTLVDTGHQVTLVSGEHTFWPHQVSEEQRPLLLAALADLGIEVIDGEKRGGIAGIELGASGLPARRVVFGDGSSQHGDVVMPFFGLVSSVDFMAGAGPDIERGLLVKTNLRTTDEHIFAAGNVCQVWTDADRCYRFYYGSRNVSNMGTLAARNMTGDSEQFEASAEDEQLILDAEGRIHSPFWE
ncbi:MAG: FAD/NAD(P)-binding oxidoreductase [Rhodospirillaceae bacterium]